MKQSEKIKVSISSNGIGSYNTRIEWPNGRQERKEIGHSLFGMAISMNKELDSKWSEGDHDFYLTQRQYDKFLTRLSEFN